MVYREMIRNGMFTADNTTNNSSGGGGGGNGAQCQPAANAQLRQFALPINRGNTRSIILSTPSPAMSSASSAENNQSPPQQQQQQQCQQQQQQQQQLTLPPPPPLPRQERPRSQNFFKAFTTKLYRHIFRLLFYFWHNQHGEDLASRIRVWVTPSLVIRVWSFNAQIALGSGVTVNYMWSINRSNL